MEGQLNRPSVDAVPALQGHLAPFRLLVDAVQDYAIFMLSPRGRIASWNAGAEKITGYSSRDIVGRHFSILYPPEAVANGEPERDLACLREQDRCETEGWRQRMDGTPFWAQVTITTIRERDGTLLGYSKIVRDLTESRRQQEALRQSEERFRLLVEGLSDHAIIMLDPEGRVMSWNAAAARMTEYGAPEIIGQHFSRFYPESATKSGWPEHELRMARQDGRFEDEGWRLRKDGTRYWANVTFTALHDRDGHLRGFAKVMRDLTEKRRLEALEYEGRNMSEFLAMFGHELRNPLAPIRNAIALLRRAGADPQSAQYSLDVLDRQSKHLARLVDDLLDVSRIHSGGFSLRRERTTLAPIVEQAVEAAMPLLNQLHHTLVTRFEASDLAVDADPARLVQMVVNLLNNAAKFTPEGGQIDLAVRRHGNDALIAVRDSGVGIGRELLPRVFDLFVQGDRDLSRTEGGLGVGLTLVRRIAELHGGAVSAHSEGAGRGAEFVVRLPLTVAATVPAEAPAPEVTAARPLRILVVDDNVDSASSMAMLLRLWGHQAYDVADGAAAIAMAQKQQPEVFLLDLGLPGMNGYELARRLREMPGLEDAILVAMSGYGQDSDVEHCLRAGFDEHLVKPVDEQRLRRILDLAMLGERPHPRADANWAGAAAPGRTATAH